MKLAFWKKVKHDCEMTFLDPNGLNWRFVCGCGFTTTDMHEAFYHGKIDARDIPYLKRLE